MSLVLNLRGTNGSGKSTAAMGLLVGPPQRVILPACGVLGATDGVTFLVGDYPPGKTGGCDRVKTFDLMRAAIVEAEQIGYPLVVFEGITVSTTFGSWADFCRERVPFWWVYLDTPLEVCLRRIEERNGGQPFDREMVASKVRSIARTRSKAIEAGFMVYDIDYREAKNGLAAIAVLG